MAEPRYPAARAVAPSVHAHFARHAAPAGRPVPDARTIEAVIDAAFWASLRREEGYVPRISIALLPPEEASHPLHFERPLPLAPSALVPVAPAVERPGIHLGVWPQNGELVIWGTTWLVPSYCFVLEVSAPGLLVIKHHRDGAGKFVNVAVLEGDHVKVIDEQASTLPECPTLLTSLLGFHPSRGGDRAALILVELAVSMRAHSRGGTLLVVPRQSNDWQASIVQPVSYAVQPPFEQLSTLLRRASEEPDSRRWQDELEEAIRAIAGLTAVDGATVINDDYELLAFGAKIVRRKGSVPVERVTLTEPVQDNRPASAHPTDLGGTRHLSAIQFVHDQRGALALVASQDGRFTIFTWSECDEVVHAHRVEALLL
jgi:hypothetical protein